MTKENKQMLTVAGLLLLKLVLIIGLFVWLTGCANTQMVENIKRESEWRAELAKDVANKAKQAPPPVGKVTEVETYVCDEYHSTIEKETYQTVHGITLEDKCRYETVTHVTQPFELPKEWFDMWDKESRIDSETEQVKSVPVCELCRGIGY